MIRRYSLLLLSLCTFPTLAEAQDAAFKSVIRPFLDAHCVDCHGPDTKKADLRLDNLKVDFADADASAVWVKVLDKIKSGEMPPPKRERPDKKETTAVTHWLHETLHTASLKKQREVGRVVLRRLNRTEYETTLRDLLGTQVEVKDILPEDNSAAGFDNVSAVLDVSSVHLLRYQEAAEKALRAAIPDRPQAPTVKVRYTGRQIAEKNPNYKTILDRSVRLDGDTLIMYTQPPYYLPCATAVIPQAGRYRVRVSAYAVGTNGKPIAMRCEKATFGLGENEVYAVHDVPAVSSDKAVVFEDTLQLKPRKMMTFTGWSLPSEREFDNLRKAGKVKALDQYQGPGLAVQWVEIEGPLDPWPPAGYQRLFGDVPLKPRSVAKLEAAGQPVPPPPAKRPDGWWLYDPLVIVPKNPPADAERLMRAFLPIAFRRPVEEKLQQYFVKIVHTALDKNVPFPEAMILGYKAALCSPHFLYLIEPMNAAPKDRPTALDDHAIATRLSYFLWSTFPDQELLDLAAKKELSKPDILRAQVERLLKDPRSERFTDNFAGQWLDLRQINATSPDPQIFPEYDKYLYWAMPRETEMFFDEILHKDLSLTNFVHSDWSFLNDRLAQHYGIPGVVGGELRKVKLPPDSHRGGVLTQASILKITADGTRTSPILRGKWVLDKIIGLPPSPPPPGTPAIDPDIRGAQTIRQQLDKHRNTPACASCHRQIDPPGFALENFDAIGSWRDFYRIPKALRPGVGQVELANYPGRKIFRGLDVEKGGELPDGRTFNDIDDYKKLLLADKDQLARNLAQKLLIYATGADIQFADREVVEQLVARSREQNYGFRALLHDVVQSRAFLNK